MEEWKNIEGYEGLYQVSNYGNIRSLDKTVNDYRGKEARTIKGKLLKPFDSGNGYLVISLHRNGKRKNFYVHRLVAIHFVKNTDNKKVVNHKDHNKSNNNAENLEWVTIKENVSHSVRLMRHPKKITHTNTGEKYITYRNTSHRYRVIVGKKEYGTYKTIEEAIKKRDKILEEVTSGGEVNYK